jgi:hypothetical protein
MVARRCSHASADLVDGHEHFTSPCVFAFNNQLGIVFTTQCRHVATSLLRANLDSQRCFSDLSCCRHIAFSRPPDKQVSDWCDYSSMRYHGVQLLDEPTALRAAVCREGRTLTTQVGL